MKKLKISFLLFIVLLAPSVSFGQHEIICKSEIKKVSVFLNQAQVERQAKVPIEAGVHTLIFDKISPVLEENSIEIKAPEGIEILSVSMQNDYLEKSEKPAFVKEIEDSLESIKEKLFEVNSDKEAILLQRELLLANKNIGGANQGVKAEELEDILGIYQKKLQEFKIDQVTLNKKQKEYTTIRDLLQQQLDEYTSGVLTGHRRVLVQLKANKSIPEAQIDFIYLVGNVNWVPSYDIRVSDLTKEVQFVLKATINQLTGEDWRGVHLFLTTSDPFSGGIKPELKPFYIQYYSDKNTNQWGAYRGNTYKKLEEAPSSLNNTIEVVSDRAIASQNSTNLQFDVQGLSTIPADGKFHLVELNKFYQSASYSRQTVPKINSDVFATANVQTNDLINQLNGEANIYLNGTFTGKTFLSQQTGDSLLITLGKDRRLIAKREKVKEMCTKSFFGSNRKENTTIELSLTNSGSEAVVVNIEDQIPLSSKEEIGVKLLDAGTAKYTPESGLLWWQVSVPAKQTIKLRFSFEVSYPADKSLEGY